MTVAIVHYHLGPGGVSQVIAAASRTLTAAGVCHVILVGSRPDADGNDLPVRVVPGLGYRRDPGNPTAGELAGALRAAARETLGSTPAIWHFHNHSLGKNPLVPEVVAALAEAGERIVLQIHDLAEEGRPGNYHVIAGCRKLYPVSSRIHYVFLNSRDLGVFTKAGLPPENAGILPNPVVVPAAARRNELRAPCPLLFAPVRGIRRKNLGELVFLSALAPAGTRFAVSRAPMNPDALPMHESWRKFVERHRLPIEFDVVDRLAPDAGAGTNFESWLAHASHIVSTSVAEGFGLPFLEAIALGKPLLGRNLPHLTAEHARHGIRCGNLYERLLIPVEWVDLVILRAYLTTTLGRNYRAYRRPLTNETVAATLDALDHDGWVDFGNLPEPLQQGAIQRMADPGCRMVPRVRIADESLAADEWLAASIENLTPAATPAQLAPYSLEIYQKNVTTLYARLADQPDTPVRFLPADAILTANLAPHSLHFLLSSEPSNSAPSKPYRAIVFDIYGTLLIAPPGGVKPDPAADPLLREILERFGHQPPQSPSTALHAAMLRHHAAAVVPYPEIDLRVLWREVLSLEAGTDTAPLVESLESAWHPTRAMPGSEPFIRQLSRSGLLLGILSNAQFNTLSSLGGVADLFAPELVILSHHHGIAKPDPGLFQMLTDRLAGRGITPGETLFIGNDPLHDIVPAAAAGFQTALFTGHPDSLRPGECSPDFTFQQWAELVV